MRVAVLDDWQGIAETGTDWSALKSRTEVTVFRAPIGDSAVVIQTLADYDVILAMRERTQLRQDVIDHLPKLRLLSFTGPRNAAVDVAACAARGITVCSTGTNRVSHDTAELALALLLAAARHIPTGDREVRAGRFQENTPPGLGLCGRTLGIIGLGKIGGRVASYGLALGMHVLAWSPNLTDARAQEVGVTRVSKDDLLSRSDAISLHVVLSDRSRGLLGAAELARLKQGAIVIKTSRGPLINEAALIAALNANRIVAGLDVYAQEPLPRDHPLRSARNTVLTPHLGYVTAENMAEFYQASVANILAWMDGNPINVVKAAP